MDERAHTLGPQHPFAPLFQRYIIRTGNQASTPVQVRGSNMIHKYYFSARLHSKMRGMIVTVIEPWNRTGVRPFTRTINPSARENHGMVS